MLFRDNMGQVIPTLHSIGHLELADLSTAGVNAVIDADWYIALIDQDGDELTEYLMADVDLQNGDNFIVWPDGTVHQDLGGVLQEVMVVNDVLKRWSAEDGFYSA